MMIAYNLCYSTILGKFDPKTGGSSGNLGVLPYPEAKTSAALARATEAHRTWQQDHHAASSQESERAAACGTAAPADAPVRVSKKKMMEEKELEGKELPSGGGGARAQGSPGGRREGSPSPGRGGEGIREWDPGCIHVAPNTAGFCHPFLRQGILPLMLREILETRVMIKGAMRRAEEAGQRVLARTLNARQFALKMISNVTYG